MTHRATKPLTEMSIRNLHADKGRPALEASNFTVYLRLLFRKMGALTSHKPTVSTAYYRNSYTSLVELNEIRKHPLQRIWKFPDAPDVQLDNIRTWPTRYSPETYIEYTKAVQFRRSQHLKQII
jgi:hypothetical protein